MANDDFLGGGGDPTGTTGATADMTDPNLAPRAQLVTPPKDTTPQPKDPPSSDTSSTDDMGKAVVDSYLRAEKHQQDVDERMAPLYAALQKQIEQPLPQTPQLQEIPKAPSQQQIDQQLNKGRLTYLAVALPLAFLLGRHGRGASWAAMGAFGAGATALMKGNQEGATDMFKTWQASADQVKEENSEKMEQYKTILENRKLNLDQQMSLIDIIAKQLNDPVLHQKAAAKDILGITKTLMDAEKARAEFEKVHNEITRGYLDKWRDTKEGQAYTSEIAKKTGGKLDPYASKESWEKANQISPYKDFLIKFYKEEKGTTSEDSETKTEGTESQALPQVNNADDFNKLPSGTDFIDPDGNPRTKN